MKEFQTLTSNILEITNLELFISHFDIMMTPYELLDYLDNSETILNSYSLSDRSFYQKASVYLYNIGTPLKVPTSKIKRTYLENNFTANVDKNIPFEAFFNNEIKNLINNPNYKKVDYGKYSANVEKSFPSITVWCWCRSLGRDHLNGKLINLTKFVTSLSTNNSVNGGNFNLSVSFVKGFYENGWTIDKKNIFSKRGDFTITKSNNTDTYQDSIANNDSFFNLLLQKNDIIFIQFETLKLEKERVNENNDLVISFSELSNRKLDFMGLIDNVTFSNDFQSNSINIGISGRDFNKIIIDDGCYFYPLEFSSKGIFLNGSTERATNRIFGSIYELNAFLDRSIEFSLKFIFDKLSNILVCEDSLFSHIQKDFVNAIEIEQKGIWKAIQIIIDPQLSNRKLVDSSIAQQMGSLMNFVNKVCQKPFVEFFSDVYGDKFYFIIRKPPTNFESYKSLLNNRIDVHPEDVYSIDLEYNNDEVYSWYKLVPQGVFLGSGTQFSVAYLPAIFFEEYAQIYGSKPLEIVTNYIDYQLQEEDDERNDEKGNYIEKQAIEDLKYLIQSNAYNPFVRKGTITLKGDRRLKKGQAIFLEQTGEVFQIESVQNNYAISSETIERMTVLEVSRGMVLEHFHKYFRIIDFSSRKVKRQKNSASIPVQEYPLDVYFDFDQDYVIRVEEKDINEETRRLQERFPDQRVDLRSKSLKSIEQMADILIKNKDCDIVVKGYTDSKGSIQFNISLSERRAERVKDLIVQRVRELINTDVSSRISTEGYGEAELQRKETDELNQSFNRTVRVQINNFLKEPEFEEVGEIDWKVDKDIFNFFLHREQWIKNGFNAKIQENIFIQ